MSKYEDGTIFEMYENNPKNFLVLKNIEVDQKKYLMICPVLKKEDKMEIIYNKPMIANFNEETEEIKIETNDEVLEKVANKLIG